MVLLTFVVPMSLGLVWLGFGLSLRIMPQKILFNWKLRAAYLLLAAGVGSSFAIGANLPVGDIVGLLVAVAFLRIALEGRGS